MKCILYNKDYQINSDTSYFKLPTFHFSIKSLEKLAKNNSFQVIKSDYFRPASKLEGIKQKTLKKYPYYPRIKCKNSDGLYLRMILRLSEK